MSDEEYYSDSNSENSISDTEEVDVSSKKPLFKPSDSIKGIKIEYNEIDDSEPDNDDIDEQYGGSDSEVEEAVSDDDDTVKNAEDEDSDIEIDEYGEPVEKTLVTKTIKNKKPPLILEDEDEGDDEDDYDDNYLQRFDNEIIKSYVNDFHPECLNHNYDEISKLSVVVRNSDGIIIDPLHRTIPYLTKYEKARVLGQRAKQIETGAKPFVRVPENIVDSYIIAELELREKKIPFIIRRPIPGGACEYWKINDLEMIAY